MFYFLFGFPIWSPFVQFDFSITIWGFFICVSQAEVQKMRVEMAAMKRDAEHYSRQVINLFFGFLTTSYRFYWFWIRGKNLLLKRRYCSTDEVPLTYAKNCTIAASFSANLLHRSLLKHNVPTLISEDNKETILESKAICIGQFLNLPQLIVFHFKNDVIICRTFCPESSVDYMGMDRVVCWLYEHG